MTFLAAAFFAGLATLAVPVLLHRRNERAPAEATVASLMLLREVEEPVRSRRAFAHKALLALRLTLLALVVCAFAQPLLETAASATAGGGAAGARLIVVDGSLSMRRGGAWAEALATARRLRDREAGPARFALAGRTPTLVADLAALEPGWARFDFAGLPAGLSALAAALPEVPGGWCAHVVSDFQASAVPERLNALVGQEGFARGVRLHPVRDAADNWAVESVRVVGARVHAVVASFAGSARSLAVTLAAADENSGGAPAIRPATARAALPAGGRRVVEFDRPAPARQARAWQVSIDDADDALAEDDARLFALAGTRASLVGVLAPRAGDALQFLEAALAASASARSVALREGAWPEHLAAIVALDPGELPAAQQRRLRRHLDGGGGVLLIAGPATQRHGALPPAGWPLDANPAPTARRVLRVDTGHPLAEAASWDDVTVTRSLALPATAAETILSLVPSAAAGADAGADAGAEPLLVEKRAGRGRVLVLLTALERGWSNLALQPTFVALVHGAVEYLARNRPLVATVGEPVAVGAAPVQLFDQAGKRLPGLHHGAAGTARALRVEKPGVYTLRAPGAETLLVANVDARESDARPVPPRFLARWQDVLRPPDAPAAPAAAASSSGVTPLAGGLLLLALLVLLAESAAANTGWPMRLWGLARPRTATPGSA